MYIFLSNQILVTHFLLSISCERGNATVIPVGALAISTRRTVFLHIPAFTKMLCNEFDNTEMGG